MLLELPIIYCKNFKEVESGKESGIDIAKDEITSMTTFNIPKDLYFRINPQTNDKFATLYFSEEETYTIDADYETTLQILNNAIKDKNRG